jgi:predicted ATP-dependent endonuclease of OLD family
MAKRPNFDTLKLLFSKRIVLVEGPTEEMFINTLLSKELDKISEIEVLAVGHKGFRLYMDIWLEFNKGNKNVKLGVIRDYDNQDNAKQNHEKYDNENINIMVRTTENYTFEDDLANIEDNREALYRYYDIENNSDEVSKYLKKNKTLNMLELCMEITDNSINLKPPQHIKEVIEWIIK